MRCMRKHAKIFKTILLALSFSRPVMKAFLCGRESFHDRNGKQSIAYHKKRHDSQFKIKEELISLY